jgi:spermidine/putrescine transport system substrate-binding protein
MKKHIIARPLSLLLFLLVFTPSCQRKTAELKIYTWADYFKPSLIERFEKENNCRIIVDTFESNESMYAKLKAGATGYDLVTPSSYFVKLLDAQGLLLPIEPAQVPNLQHVDPDYLKIAMDPQMRHSVPYMLTNSGIAYLKSKVKNFQPSWKVFERGDLKGRMTMLNDMRETLGAALKSLGYSLNSRNEKELEAARDVVIRWKKNLAKFEAEQYKSGIASGEFLVVHGYSGDLLQVQNENPNLEFVIPAEGTSISCDDLVILKTAQDVKLAHAFINFIHDPGVAAENTNFLSYVCPNKTSYSQVNSAIRDNPAIFLAPELRAKCEVIDDLGPDTAKYTKIWDQIKAAP